jgi:hypothetical protein
VRSPNRSLALASNTLLHGFVVGLLNISRRSEKRYIIFLSTPKMDAVISGFCLKNFLAVLPLLLLPLPCLTSDIRRFKRAQNLACKMKDFQ